MHNVETTSWRVRSSRLFSSKDRTVEGIRQEPREIHRRDVGLYVAGLLFLLHDDADVPRGVVQMLATRFFTAGVAFAISDARLPTR
jgi:hypothetical protein